MIETFPKGDEHFENTNSLVLILISGHRVHFQSQLLFFINVDNIVLYIYK